MCVLYDRCRGNAVKGILALQDDIYDCVSLLF
jgi:hypothetical protein